jgi:hypothetical protein
MTESRVDIYAWPSLLNDPDDPLEVEWATWAYTVRDELQPVYKAAFEPLPDDPIQLDQVVSQDIDGWLPRVAALAVKAEYYLATAKGQRYPQPTTGPNGKPTTAGERDAQYEGSLAGFRFVRDELDTLTRRLSERVRWAQSVRKVHGDAQ